MANILTFLDEYGNIYFKDKAFCIADSLIFSCLSYIPKSYIKDSKTEEGNKKIENIIKLYEKFKTKKRYSDIELTNFVEITSKEKEQQFAALTLYCTDFVYISYRGTDGTILGWKEDLNLSFMECIPAQEEALNYLNSVALKFIDKPILIGGHSKGGNLAIYAGVKCSNDIKNRIVKIFSHDGPSFKPYFIKQKDYKDMSLKINKTVPESSIIGMLFSSEENYEVIKSNRFSLLQHDPFSWQIENGDLKKTSDVLKIYKQIDSSINRFIYSLRQEQKRDVINIVYQFFNTIKIDCITCPKDILKQAYKHRYLLKEFMNSLSQESKENVKQFLRILFEIIKLDSKNYILEKQREDIE